MKIISIWGLNKCLKNNTVNMQAYSYLMYKLQTLGMLGRPSEQLVGDRCKVSQVTGNLERPRPWRPEGGRAISMHGVATTEVEGCRFISQY